MSPLRWMMTLGLALALGGCDGDEPGLDAGPRDAGGLDAGGGDAGAANDAGAIDDGGAADSSVTDAGDDAWEMLFNGVDLTGIELHATTPGDITIADGAITCGNGPNGYWYTAQSYDNYVLEMQWRFTRPPGLAPGDDESFLGNSGYLIHIEGDHRVWPACVEVQGMNLEVGRIFSIGGAPGVVAREDADARRRLRNPVGEWNDLRITSQDGALRVELNGEEIADSDPSTLRSGPIGFQCEGAEVSWRDVRLRRL